jgi:Spy/CpxP family protein refolding chaperone
MMWMMGKELNLSADQLTQLKAIQKDCMDSTQSIRTDIQAKMKQMMDLWMVDQPDAGAIKDLASQLDALRMQIRNSAIDHAVSAIGVLSADQRAKLRDMMKKSPGMCMGMGCGICCGAGMGGPGMGCPMGGGMGKGMGPGGCGASCPYMK